MPSQGTPHKPFSVWQYAKSWTCTFSGWVSLPYINLDLRDITNYDEALHNHG